MDQIASGQPQKPRKPGTFKAGFDSRRDLQAIKPHRPKGTVHVITRDLRRGIVDAAVNLGRDGRGGGGLTGYLEFLGRKHPKAFSSLLARVLPLQVDSTHGH